jgi:hypothetical protein
VFYAVWMISHFQPDVIRRGTFLAYDARRLALQVSGAAHQLKQYQSPVCAFLKAQRQDRSSGQAAGMAAVIAITSRGINAGV